VEVTGARYDSSQPWPFPSSLMLGFTAAYVSGEAVASDGELEEARWFSRAELEEAAAGGGEMRLPPPIAIARTLIDAWLAAR
jgi:NAD+ diphosphatase